MGFLDEESKQAIKHCCWCLDCSLGSNHGKVKPSYSGPKDVVANSWWCCYCFCGGCGLGPVPSPMFSYGCKYILCKNTCESTDCSGVGGDGWCHSNHRCGCCSQQCQCLPAPDSPRCVCFGCNAGPNCLKECRQAIWDLWLLHLHCCSTEPWWLCYCFCCGCGIHEVTKGKPLLFSDSKCCPIRSTCNSAMPNDRDGCCMNVQQFCCWNTTCQIPPPAPSENPVCACCGMGGTSRRPASSCLPGSSSAPDQQVMGNAA